MSYLSANEAKRVEYVRPDVLSIATQIMQDFERETGGRRLFIPAHGGHRSRPEQAKLYADSLRIGGGKLAYPVAHPDSAPHVVGAAIDFHIVGGRNNNDNPDPLFATMAAIAERHGMRAGYYWTGAQRDVFHVETRESPSVRRQKWEALTRRRLQRLAIVGAIVVLGGFVAWKALRA